MDVYHTNVRGTQDLEIIFLEFVGFYLSLFMPQMNFELLVIAFGVEANKSFRTEKS